MAKPREDRSTMAGRIQARMDDLGWDQSSLVNATGFSKGAVSRWLSGGGMKDAAARKVAAVLGMTVEYLRYGIGPGPGGPQGQASVTSPSEPSDKDLWSRVYVRAHKMLADRSIVFADKEAEGTFISLTYLLVAAEATAGASPADADIDRVASKLLRLRNS